jgi:hypothetical protein
MFEKKEYKVFGRHGLVGEPHGLLADAKRAAASDNGSCGPLRWKWEEVDGVRTYYSDGDYRIEVSSPRRA